DGDAHCTKLMDFILTKFLPGEHLAGIILAGRWRPGDLDGLKRTALNVKPYAERVIVFGSIVEYQMPLPRILATNLGRADAKPIAKYRKGAQQQFDLKLAKAFEGSPIEYVSIFQAICTPDCTVWAEEGTVPMQFDYGHLTPAGSLELARRL